MEDREFNHTKFVLTIKILPLEVMTTSPWQTVLYLIGVVHIFPSKYEQFTSLQKYLSMAKPSDTPFRWRSRYRFNIPSWDSKAKTHEYTGQPHRWVFIFVCESTCELIVIHETDLSWSWLVYKNAPWCLIWWNNKAALSKSADEISDEVIIWINWTFFPHNSRCSLSSSEVIIFFKMGCEYLNAVIIAWVVRIQKPASDENGRTLSSLLIERKAFKPIQNWFHKVGTWVWVFLMRQRKCFLSSPKIPACM